MHFWVHLIKPTAARLRVLWKKFCAFHFSDCPPPRTRFRGRLAGKSYKTSPPQRQSKIYCQPTSRDDSLVPDEGFAVPIVEKIIAKSSKRVADGRPLPKEWLTGAAKSYDLKQYAARINMEHIVGYDPKSTFHVYGTVQSLTTKPADKGEIYLVAEIDAHDDLADMWEDGQKRGFSIEIDPDFADIHKPYLYGLAVTDQPASLGTQFSRTDEPASREQFSYDPETDTCHGVVKEGNTMTPKEKAAAEAAKLSTGTTITTTTTTDDGDPAPSDPPPAPDAKIDPPAPSGDFSAQLSHYTVELATVRKERDDLKAQLDAAEGKFATDREALETTHSEALAAKDTEIDELKGKIPNKSYTPRPKTTAEDSGKSFRF